MSVRNTGEAALKGSRRDPLIGSLINGKYRIQRAIARGGMGRIYVATQEPIDRPVALKVVQADSVNEEESQFLKRFLLEASILAKLQHPNVVMLFDYGRIEGLDVEMYFIAMEYLDGETLTQRFKARPVLSAAEVLLLFRQIARGLREAHSRGIVHRDLKPSNIIIVPEADGEIVKLVDFGIGKIVVENGAEDLTQAGVVVGTPKYMAPEQFEGVATPSSDVYSLGTIVYQALTGTLPFQGNTLGEFMVAKFAHAIPPIREVNPRCEVSPSFELLVARMLSRVPEERPPIDQVIRELGPLEEELFGASGARRLLHTGSGPAPILPDQTGTRLVVTGSGSAPPPMTMPDPTGPPVPISMRVPHTVVAHASLFPGITPRPMATSALPFPEQPKRSGAWTALVVVALMLGVGVVAGALWVRTRAAAAAETGGSEERGTSTTSGAETAAPFTLAIESTPEGATVMEGETALGSTPLQISIDPKSVAAGPRTFVIKKDGFVSTTIAQGPSSGPVKQAVALAPEPTTPPPPKTKPRVITRPPDSTPKPPPAPNPDHDIRRTR